MKHYRPCTCSTPPAVDLTEAFLEHNYHRPKHGAELKQAKLKQPGSSCCISADIIKNGNTNTTPKDTMQRRQNDNQQQEEQRNPQQEEYQQLFENLKSHGWSHLCIDLSSVISDGQESWSEESTTSTTATTTSTNHHHPYQSILQNCGQDWKELLVNLFESSSSSFSSSSASSDTDDHDAIYRVAESGSPDGMVEPKQSWEVKRCQCHHHYRPCSGHAEKTSRPRNQLERQEWRRLHLERLHAWTNLFHDVASTVRQVVGFPKNVLLQEEPCCRKHNNNDDDGQEHHNQNYNSTSCSLDLLRAFYYETASSQANNPSPPATSINAAAFGSNEHTDWGSFTIVWQDDVPGCLQTFCHACQSWNSVQQVEGGTATSRRCNSDNDNMLYLVVHVGDVTSLAIGQQHTAAAVTESSSGNASIPHPSTSEDALGTNVRSQRHHATAAATASTVIWPSPRHRVCLPTDKQQRRASLVYFSYPPPELSIRSISQALHEWYHQTTTAAAASCARHDDSNRNSNYTESHWVPYEDYFLLKNQAMQGNTDDNECQSQFEKIASTPLRIVFNEKWNQVQRG